MTTSDIYNDNLFLEHQRKLHEHQNDCISLQVLKWKNIDAKWVVKYLPKFIMKYNCHINTEVTGCIGSVKYVCGYFTKGHDMSCFALEEDEIDENGKRIINEIEAYKNGRFIGAPEAHWGICGYTKYYNDPTVMRLHLHQENKQSICYQEDLTEIQNNPERLKFLKRTTFRNS